MSESLPPDWRQLGVHALRRWLGASAHHMPYTQYKRKSEMVRWIEENVERHRPRCPACGHPCPTCERLR